MKKFIKAGLWGFVALIILGIIVTSLGSDDTVPTSSNNENTKTVKSDEGTDEKATTEQEQKKEEIASDFDERAWNDYLKLYDAHNKLMNAMEAYVDGKVSTVDFYDYCKEARDWFRNASVSFKYGNTDDEKEYLSAFTTFAIADQMAAESLMKYVESGSTKDLSKAREEIERAKQAAVLIAKNRVVFLKKMGLTEDEIKEKVDQMAKELEKLDNQK